MDWAFALLAVPHGTVMAVKTANSEAAPRWREASDTLPLNRESDHTGTSEYRIAKLPAYRKTASLLQPSSISDGGAWRRGFRHFSGEHEQSVLRMRGRLAADSSDVGRVLLSKVQL